MTAPPGRLPLAAAATLLLAAGAGDAPADYRFTARVTPAAGAGVQRLDLPAAVLASLQRADGGDLRLFDARGRALPVARVGARAARARAVALDALPIVGAADAGAASGVSLRLDERGGARVARIDGVVGGGGGSTSAVGALLDARGLSGAARSLVLDAALPAGQPVTLAVEASPDLRNWRPIAEQVAYHAGRAPVPETLPLAGAALARDWLRVTWRGATRLVAPVTIRRATLTIAPADAPPAPVAVVRLPPPRDTHHLDLALPFATPLRALSIVPAADAVVPFRLLGRADPEQSWAVLGEGTAARIGGVARGGAIPLAGPTPRLLRVEADRRSDGFAAGAAVTLRFDPAGIVFVPGAGPLTLAAGRAGAEDRSLPLDGLVPGGGAAADALPEARIDRAATAPLDLSAGPAARSGRALALWATLLGATALLGWMALRLARPGAGPPAAP